MSVEALRAAVPERYGVRSYPDITHTVRCQHPVPDWDPIPGARGCTAQSCGFRDHHKELAKLQAICATCEETSELAKAVAAAK